MNLKEKCKSLQCSCVKGPARRLTILILRNAEALAKYLVFPFSEVMLLAFLKGGTGNLKKKFFQFVANSCSLAKIFCLFSVLLFLDTYKHLYIYGKKTIYFYFFQLFSNSYFSPSQEGVVVCWLPTTRFYYTVLYLVYHSHCLSVVVSKVIPVYKSITSYPFTHTHNSIRAPS